MLATHVPAIVVRRTIDAPAEELFDAWLDAKSLADWMRPAGVSRTTTKVDARVGGSYEVVMHFADHDVSHTGRYLRIERPKVIEFTWFSQYTYDRETRVKVEFRAAGAATEVVVTHTFLPDAEMAEAHTGGWTDVLVALATAFE